MRRAGSKPGDSIHGDDMISPNRFSNYRDITAQREDTATCGHPIHRGDLIGWNRPARRTVCATCWRRWVEENREADQMEASGQW